MESTSVQQKRGLTPKTNPAEGGISTEVVGQTASDPDHNPEPGGGTQSNSPDRFWHFSSAAGRSGGDQDLARGLTQRRKGWGTPMPKLRRGGLFLEGLLLVFFRKGGGMG